MNRNQKIVLMATAVVVSLILHFSFCDWHFGTKYSLSRGWYILPHVSEQIAGYNTTVDHITVGFFGVSCASDTSKAVAVSLGIALPLVMIGASLFFLVTSDRSATQQRPVRPSHPPLPPSVP